MTGTEVPVSVNINAGGDEGPYTYDHMLAVTFFTDGHTDDQFTRTSYYNVPDYGETLTVDEDVYITKDTTRVEVSMDVLTCLNNPCDLTVPSTEGSKPIHLNLTVLTTVVHKVQHGPTLDNTVSTELKLLNADQCYRTVTGVTTA